MFSNLILDYEKTRQIIKELEKESRLLIDNCHYSHGSEWSGVERCHDKAYSWFLSSENRAREGHYENTYDEVIENTGCDNCVKARDIKNTSLRKAKSDFGNIKRKLSAAGKRLIKENAL